MGGPAILLVCAANQCRSPLAAAVLRDLLAQAAPHVTWRVESAGLYGESGRPATALAQRSRPRPGLDLTGHRAQAIDDVRLDGYDLVLVMEEVQRDALWAAYPGRRQAITRLGDLAGVGADVEDPTGKGLAEHRATLRQLQRLLTLGLPRVLALARTDPSA